MHSLITSYLLQSKECILPGIGTLQIKTIPAAIDNAANQITPPSEEIVFNEQSNSNATGLIKYIADKRNININEAENLLVNFCKEEKEKINNGERLTIKTIGTLQKNENGKIYFEREAGFNFYNPINIDKVYKPNINKEEKITETENDFPEQNREENKVIIARSYWGWWAAILTAIAFAAIFFYSKDQNFSGSSAGNHQKLIIDSASATYNILR